MTSMDIPEEGTHQGYTKMTKFNPEAYWQGRGKLYPVGTKKIEGELAYIERWLRINKPSCVLEVGSGWGRIFLALRGLVPKYQMVDFVESMRQGCLQKTGVLPDQWDGQTLPYTDRSFDLVLSVDVLLHVPPEDIDRVFAEHVRVTKRWMYITTNGAVYRPLARHCFWHDYIRLCSRHKMRILGLPVFKQGQRVHYILERAEGGRKA